jgi:hypothetical protein
VHGRVGCIDQQNTVSRMINGGSAGLRMMICLAPSRAADLDDGGRRGLGELVDVGAGAGAGRLRRDRGDDLGVRDGDHRDTAATTGIVA